jgi:predicted dehydrogenase
MKICFIGNCGHSGQALAYLKSRTDVEFAGIAPWSAEEGLTASPDPALPYFSDACEMLDTVGPDLAIVSPVFGRTADAIVACAERGIDVFSEKPIATTLADLARVESAVKKSGIRFTAMHYLRYDPAFYHGAQLVRSGAVGEVQMLTAQKSYKYGTRPAWYHDRALYGGTIPWVGIHAIDWIYHFSEKKFCAASAESIGESPETAVLCRFSMEDGVIASINLDYHRPASAATHGDDRIRVVGKKGVLEVMDGKIHLMNEEGDTVLVPTEAPELLEEFLNGGDFPPADEILYLTRVALLARESSDTHTTVRI